MVIALKRLNEVTFYYLLKKKVGGISKKDRFYFKRGDNENREKALAEARRKEIDWNEENLILNDQKINENFNLERKMINDGCLRGFTMTKLHNRFITFSYTIHVNRIRYYSSINLGKMYSFDEGFNILMGRYLELFDPAIKELPEIKEKIKVTRDVMYERFVLYSSQLKKPK